MEFVDHNAWQTPELRDYLATNGGKCSCSHQQSLDDGVPVLAFVVHHLDVVQIRVSPVHQPADQVQRDAVWEYDLTVHQLGSVLAVHVTALHLWDLTVVCEEHLPVETKGSGLHENGCTGTKKQFYFHPCGFGLID